MKADGQDMLIELKVESQSSPAMVVLNGNPVNAATGAASPLNTVQIVQETSEVWVIKFAVGAYFVWGLGDGFAFKIDKYFFEGEVKGMCGNSDGNPENDRKGPNGFTNSDAELFSEWSRALGQSVSPASVASLFF